MKLIGLILSLLFVGQSMALDYRNYQIENSTRRGENIEWSIFYIYNRLDEGEFRVALIGDSICNEYQRVLRERLANRANVAFWASSYCVTDPAYLPLLNAFLDQVKPSLIVFNNGLHSLVSDPEQWSEAYVLAVRYIVDRYPGIPVVLLNSTPLKKDAKGKVAGINQRTAEAAKKLQLPLIDIYSECDKFDRSQWRDDYHFIPEAVEKQGDFLVSALAPYLPQAGNLRQQSTATGPSGALK